MPLLQRWNRSRSSWPDPTGNPSVKPAGWPAGWPAKIVGSWPADSPAKITTFRSDIAMLHRKNSSIHYSNTALCWYMSIKSTLPHLNQIKKVKKRKLCNKWISLLGLYLKKFPSAFYAAGRSRTGHLTSTRPNPTRPDRHLAPVDTTDFHLCIAVREPVRRSVSPWRRHVRETALYRDTSALRAPRRACCRLPSTPAGCTLHQRTAHHVPSSNLEESLQVI